LFTVFLYSIAILLYNRQRIFAGSRSLLGRVSLLQIPQDIRRLENLGIGVGIHQKRNLNPAIALEKLLPLTVGQWLIRPPVQPKGGRPHVRRLLLAEVDQLVRQLELTEQLANRARIRAGL